MTTRGIVCSAHEVRGLPKGAVSLLVRPIKPQPVLMQGDGSLLSEWSLKDDNAGPSLAEAVGHCPFGKPGDRLWVREAFVAERGTNRIVGYQADGARSDKKSQYGAASVHMPLWASRLTLQLSEVRVEQREEGWVWLLSVSVVPQDSKESE